MHAIVCRRHGDAQVMQYEEVPDPTPGRGEVLVKTQAIGVNYVDTMRRSGNHPAAPSPPFTPGIELCGRVVSVGPGARRFQTGDRIIGRLVTNGAYAELVAVEERFTIACPETVKAEEAAALFVNPQTAFHALTTKGNLQAGENVLLMAAGGGVGLCAVQIARLLGARVLAAASTPEKRDLAAQMGAEVLIDYSQPDWPRAVREATGDRGVDLILESTGGKLFETALARISH